MQITAWVKIQTVQWFLIKCGVGLSKSCELNFMLVGRTRFSPDCVFGLIKRKYSRTRVSSLTEIAEVLEKSTTCLQNKVYIIGDKNTSQHFSHYN